MEMQEKGERPKNRTHRLKNRMWRKVNECQIFSSACAITSRESRSPLAPLIASCRCQVELSCLDARGCRSKAHSYVCLPCRLEFHPWSLELFLSISQSTCTTASALGFFSFVFYSPGSKGTSQTVRFKPKMLNN